ncbi:hypothetical protein J8J23_21070, partial [Mycobacterium tuberculosis]|uniref:hypothetical protein n=1 Tax=Mycobacterium tuberculosis TaxID=1773 RepID=UPI001AE0D006
MSVRVRLGAPAERCVGSWGACLHPWLPRNLESKVPRSAGTSLNLPRSSTNSRNRALHGNTDPTSLYPRRFSSSRSHTSLTVGYD